MKKFIRSSFIFTLMVLLLASCTWFSGGDPTPEPAPAATPTITTIELAVQTDVTTYTALGQIIKYTHTVKNAGAGAVMGPVTVTGAVCPEVTTVGNLDATFDGGESIVCTSEYTVAQPDLDAGSKSNIFTATVSGINSNPVTITVSKALPSVLNLTKTANPATYDHAGQVITYTYVIMNSGATTLGPAQFIVKDAGFPSPINCGDANASIASTLTLTCYMAYTITEADMVAGTVSTSATASGGGSGDSPAVSTTITKGTGTGVIPVPNSTLTAGSTVQHKVESGEWLWQIARCYGADPAKTMNANPQLTDPGFISPNTTVTVPNIGSAGAIYGPPCVKTHTVQAGDTWNSIALIYKADPFILQIVNANNLTIGRIIKVPINSAK